MIIGIAYTAHMFGENYTTQGCALKALLNLYAWLAVLAAIGLFMAWFEEFQLLRSSLSDNIRSLTFCHYIFQSACGVELYYCARCGTYNNSGYI